MHEGSKGKFKTKKTARKRAAANETRARHMQIRPIGSLPVFPYETRSPKDTVRRVKLEER
jgi:hypothetical protein